MLREKSRYEPMDEYHDFIQKYALQVDAFASITRATKLLETPNLSLEAVRTRLGLIEAKWKQITERHENMILYQSHPSCATHEYFANEMFGTYEDSYATTCAGFSTVISLSMPTTSTPTSTAPAPAVTVDHQQRRTQVPVVKLPRFTGNFLEWTEFRDHFRALIVNDPSFDSFHRLYYLKSCLEGDAASILKNITITAGNYDVAWKMLTERYENNRRLLSLLLCKLFSLKSVSKEGSSVDLRQLLDSAQETIDALAELGRPLSDDIAVHVISQHLDRVTREAWELSLGSDAFATYDQLKIFLTAKVRALEASTPNVKPTRPNSSQTRGKAGTASQASTHHANSKLSGKCNLCGEAHPVYKCVNFNTKTVSQRWDFVKQNALCSNCLSSYHKNDSCKSQRTCAYCKKRHHSLLHAQTQKVTITDAGCTSSNDTPVSEVNLVQSHLSTSQVPAHIILTTAWVLVIAASQRVVKLRALLDPGSTHSFHSRAAANELRTKTYSTSMLVNGIGRHKSATVTQIVPISVSSISNKEIALTTDALILDELTSYVPKFRFPLSRWPHLDGLTFADGNPTDDTQIHLIIGADLYAYAIRDGIIRGRRDEPVAINTIFGWVLSGTSNSTNRPNETISVQANHSYIQYDDDLNSSLKRFWETEETCSSNPISEDDENVKPISRTPIHEKMMVDIWFGYHFAMIPR